MGEGLSGIGVNLFTDSNCDGTPDAGPALATADTVGDGQYLFDTLPIGTAGNPVCYVTQVDNADPDLGSCNVIQTPTAFSAQLTDVAPDNLTHDYYFVSPEGQVGDQVWCDGLVTTGNNVFDIGEGLNNITVNLFDDANCDGSADSAIPTAVTQTAGDGDYLFGGLAVGVAGTPACYVTQVDAADPDLNGCDIPQTPTSFTAQLTDVAPLNLAHDYYFAAPIGSVGDQVWCDGVQGTGNNIFDVGEGLSGIGVNLFTDSNCDGTPDAGPALATADTVGDGQYLFDTLPIGTAGNPVCYVTQVDNADPDLGSCNVIQTPTAFSAQLTDVAPDNLTHDYYFVSPEGQVGDQVWCDGLVTTGNNVFDIGEGLNNITVNLFDDANCDGSADSAIPTAVTQTAGDGDYLFGGLAVGVAGTPACYVTQVDAADPDLNGCDIPQTPTSFTAQLTDVAPLNLAHDYYFAAPIGSVGDQVWCDGVQGTGNNIFDVGEGLSGIGVSLFTDSNCDGTPDAGPALSLIHI